MPNYVPFAPPMPDSGSVFLQVTAALVAVLYLLWWPPLVAVVRRNRELPWAPGLLWGLLGPFGLLATPRPRTAPALSRYPNFHPWAWLSGSLVVLLGSGGTAWFCLEVNQISGESLQAPVAVALGISGLVGGFVAAVFGRRVAFFENLGILWSYAAALLGVGRNLEVFFTYGTTPVFLLVVALTSLLILFTALLLGASVGYLFTGDGAWAPSFSYEAWVGRRYLMAKRRRSFISVITFISIAGVTVGVWAMLVVLSVMSGFEADLKTKILGTNSHMMIQKAGGDFYDWDPALQKVRANPRVTGASPFVFNEVMLSSESNLSGALLKGVDPASADQVSDLGQHMVQGGWKNLADPSAIPDPNTAPPFLDEEGEPKFKKDDKDKPAPMPAFGVPVEKLPAGAVLPGIVIGQELSRNLRVFMGDRLTVVSPVAELGPTGPVPRARTFRVAGIFYSGMYEYDAKFVYIELKEAQRFFTMKGAVTGIEVRVDDIEGTTRIGREIVSALGGFPYRSRDWKDMNRNLFAALKLEKIAMFIILAFIILVASFNILSTLIMVVLEKGKEIAILKGMGATDASVMKIFVTYGLVIGVFGTLLGLVLGFFSCKAIETFGIGLDPEVYYIANLPVRMNPVEFALVALAAMIISHLATVYPALQAARLKPVDGLRYE